MKKCSTCAVSKPLTEFFRDKTRPDGYKYGCKECRDKYHQRWRAENRDRLVAQSAAYRAENRDKMNSLSRSWARRNRERVSAHNIAWRERNRAHHNAYKAARRADRSAATPAWADQAVIKDFYMEADYFGLEVDHIVPLRSPLVCGLHCEANMQLLTGEQNLKKGNRRWPDMP